MGEHKSDQWVQFICFKTRIAINEELIQETWIPLARGLQARGINSIVLSQKVNAKDDSNDFVLISKTWWDAVNAIRGAFPDGLQVASSSEPRAAISTAQVGCFQINRTKTANKGLEPNRHEASVQDEIKVYIMTAKPLSSNEAVTRAETLCLVTGFQSYCIYKLDHLAFPQDGSGFYSWIIEVYVQSFFKDTVFEQIHASEQFEDWELTVHQDIIQFSL